LRPVCLAINIGLNRVASLINISLLRILNGYGFFLLRKKGLGGSLQRQPAAFIFVLLFGIWNLEFFRTGLIPSLRYGNGLGGGFTKKTSTAQQCWFSFMASNRSNKFGSFSHKKTSFF
jgi:hypothetical protein